MNDEVFYTVTASGYAIWWKERDGKNTQSQIVATLSGLTPQHMVFTTALAYAGAFGADYKGERRRPKNVQHT